MRKQYEGKERKSIHKFEIVRGQELLVQVPLSIADAWAEMQARVEELAGQAGPQILRANLENEVTRRVGPPHRPNPSAGCVRWGRQPGYVVFSGRKVPVERLRVRTREGQEVELESYRQLQQDGKLQRNQIGIALADTVILVFNLHNLLAFVSYLRKPQPKLHGPVQVTAAKRPASLIISLHFAVGLLDGIAHIVYILPPMIIIAFDASPTLPWKYEHLPTVEGSPLSSHAKYENLGERRIDDADSQEHCKGDFVCNFVSGCAG